MSKKSDTREDLMEAHNRGEQDASEGKDMNVLPLAGLLSTDKEIERERAYKAGYRHTRDQKK